MSSFLKHHFLTPHQPLQNIAKKITRRGVKRGDKGIHVIALQRSLNAILFDSRIRSVPKSWPLLRADGKFGDNTFAAVQGFQRYADHTDRVKAREYAKEWSSGLGDRGYKKTYVDQRLLIHDDGIVGFRTLFKIDTFLSYTIENSIILE